MKLFLIVTVALLVGLAVLYFGNYRVSEDDQGRLRIRQVETQLSGESMNNLSGESM
jgi:hypothetical protein